ncbi:TMEM165/GDT1 family protein, partial [Methylicorpusculum sp.]
METAQIALQNLASSFMVINFAELSLTGLTSFTLIAAAEIGDKSQLVCMTLAARHRSFPIIFGA